MTEKLKLNFLGDVMLGERFEKLNRGVISNLKRGIDPFQFCKKDLNDSDLNIANLECVVSTNSEKSYPFSKFMIIAPDQLNILVENNIKIVNLANNHIFDHGERAFYETRAYLEEKNIKYFGFDEKHGIQKEPLVVKKNGFNIAFIGYDLSNFKRDKFEIRIDEIVDILSSIKDTNDFLILSLHWGYEYSNSPTSFMINAAEKFLENNVDIIYGHHPHIFQGITKLDNKIFAPSLGNFIFDDERERNRKTGILNIQIENDIIEYNLKPFFINDYYQPFPCDELDIHYKELDELLQLNIELTKSDLSDFDSLILENSKNGHSKNKIRVRKEILYHIKNYLPYIPQIFKSKIIDKRVKKHFRK